MAAQPCIRSVSAALDRLPDLVVPTHRYIQSLVAAIATAELMAIERRSA